MKPLISEIQIVPIKPNNGLLAFASCVIDNRFYIGSIAIHKKLHEEGYRLTYPTKKIGNKELNLFHPITREFSQALEEAIFQKYERLIT